MLSMRAVVSCNGVRVMCRLAMDMLRFHRAWMVADDGDDAGSGGDHDERAGIDVGRARNARHNGNKSNAAGSADSDRDDDWADAAFAARAALHADHADSDGLFGD